MVSTNEFGVHKEFIECSSLSEAFRMLEIADNTFYDDPAIDFYVEECIYQECPN
jgi:hypothetical protein